MTEPIHLMSTLWIKNSKYFGYLKFSVGLEIHVGLESDAMSWLQCCRGKDVCFWPMKDGLSKAKRARGIFYKWGLFYLMLHLLSFINDLKMMKKSTALYI